MGAYSDKVKQLTRVERNQQTKARNASRKAAHIKKNSERQKFTPQEQLKRLDFRLGVNAGAVKERKRLHELIHGAAIEKSRVKTVYYFERSGKKQTGQFKAFSDEEALTYVSKFNDLMVLYKESDTESGEPLIVLKENK